MEALGLDRTEVSESCSVVSDSLRPQGLFSLWNSPGQKTGVGSCSLLQGIFPTQRLNPSFPHCRRILYQLSHQGSPREGLISTTALLREDYVNRTTWHIILRDFFFFHSAWFLHLPSFLYSFLQLCWASTAAWAFPQLKQAGAPLWLWGTGFSLPSCCRAWALGNKLNPRGSQA